MIDQSNTLPYLARSSASYYIISPIKEEAVKLLGFLVHLGEIWNE